MTSHQWGLITFHVIRQTALVKLSFFKTPRFFANGKSQDLTPALQTEAEQARIATILYNQAELPHPA